MKTFPKTPVILAALGIFLLLAGDLYQSFGFLVCVLGCVLLLCAWLLGLRYFSRIENAKTKRIAKIVKTLTFTALFAFLVSFIWVEGLILTHDDGTENPTAPTLVVLGAGLNGDQPSLTLIARLQTALEYLQANPSAVAIVTGGQGAYETVTEASAMAKWLTRKGIVPDRIYPEDRSTDTRENLRNAREIMAAENLSGPIAVVSNSFHLYRARILAEEAGFEAVQTLSAPVPKVPLRWLSASVYLREYCSILLLYARSIF
ncbi:MAG: YdcF family protein [Clostridia bacterium]|nr:YdcF family protein [Clostridia bacterium]